MRRGRFWLAAGVSLAVGACVANTAPGNDREAGLDPPVPPAEMAAADDAIADVDISLLHPQIITESDRTALSGRQPQCRFRFTRVGYPVFLYSLASGTFGIMKLNGKLVPLRTAGTRGGFASGGIVVQLRQLDAEAEVEEQHPSELVLMLPGAAHELGYRGFSKCGGESAATSSPRSAATPSTG